MEHSELNQMTRINFSWKVHFFGNLWRHEPLLTQDLDIYSYLWQHLLNMFEISIISIEISTPTQHFLIFLPKHTINIFEILHKVHVFFL